MRKPLLWTLLVLVIAASTASYAESEVRHQDELWIPSLSFALTAHNEKGDLSATNDAPNLSFPLNVSKSTTLAGLRFGVELMSPVVRELKFKPRFFVTGGALWAAPSNGLSSVDDNARTRDDYREINLKNKVDRQDNAEFPDPGDQSRDVEDSLLFEGQGNRINSEQLNNAWFVSVGAAFTFPQAGFSIRVRPSLEYLGEIIETRGEFRLVTKGLNDLHPDYPTAPFPENYILHEANLHDRSTHHSVGPGIELEFINHLDGNLTLSIFTQLRVMWILNDPKTVVRGFATNDDAGNNLTSNPVEPIAARYSFDRQRMNFQGGLGIRLGWKKLAFGF